MTFKTIFIIVVSVLVTIVLMNNTDEVNFWIFGNARVPKLAVLGVMFGLGLIIGFMAGRPRKKIQPDSFNSAEPLQDKDHEYTRNDADQLSDEDRDYIR
ncbi:hypothetical protein [Daejeonella sp.]|uniref:hypothetical protein n=1 Tax=Daejeonella sp. TaxID=2805397 RepID=UPI0027232768|nr:hypothetical protein [Daejeonella sp.]MDO8994407.1 hypothetical protein [Daejeonella sp.]MDP2412770.1 hypothetical protein [Daejeonella sp.]